MLNDRVTRNGQAYTVVFEGNCPDKDTNGGWLNCTQLLKPVDDTQPWIFTDNVYTDVMGTQADCINAMAVYLNKQLEG